MKIGFTRFTGLILFGEAGRAVAGSLARAAPVLSLASHIRVSHAAVQPRAPG